jgi:hydroxymethylglutaryl-CoA lyase
MTIPGKVRLVEVGPRDGLQNEKEIVPTAIKIDLINRLSETGLTYIESGAFVSPKWVPQMADTPEIYAGIKRKSGVVYPALVPNDRGMEGAIASGVEEIAVFASASEPFSQKNINCTIAESLERFVPVIAMAKEHGIRVRGYVSCVAGCPYQGAVRAEKVAEVSARLYEMGCYEISLGDTIGVGTPNIIQAMLYETVEHVPVTALALHCHDTYGQALANIYAGLQMGVAVFDSSVAGLGGCPYAKGATGNVATEDVLYMLNGLNIETGVDLDRVVDVAWFISDHLGRKPVSNVANALKAKLENTMKVSV